MNSVRKAIRGREEELRAVLDAAYLAIARYQARRDEAREKELRSAIDRATRYCAQFKPLIPAYKRRYFDILENVDVLDLSARDLIMTFDRAIYELHTRMERSSKERDALGPWSKEILEILDGRRTIPGVSVKRDDFEVAASMDEAHPDEPAAGEEVTFVAAGRTVVGGRRAGSVRVLQAGAAWETVHAGEIVACRMTTPELIHAVDRVAGLITEQGGLMCHAAILAREFNIPCVVGCGPFLSQLVTGDRVVLDASAGILLKHGIQGANP